MGIIKNCFYSKTEEKEYEDYRTEKGIDENKAKSFLKGVETSQFEDSKWRIR